jgi:hypothetical protein
MFNGMEKRRFTKMEIDRIDFANGIYIVFEDGEKAHGSNRIVRVGTTTGDATTLASRLYEHYENEGRSVFRNHIALCLLKNIGDPYNLTDLFFTSKIQRNKWKKTANDEELKGYTEINELVSNYIHNHCYFIAFPVDKGSRRVWEEKIISTVYSCSDCGPSSNWLGKNIHQKRNIIRESGLWNIQHVNNKHILTDEEIFELKQIVEVSSKK